MQKEILINQDSPKTIGPYSSAVKVGRIVFLSGQLPIDGKTGEIIQGGIEEQTKQALENLLAVLKPYKLDAQNVVKVTIFLKDLKHIELLWFLIPCGLPQDISFIKIMFC